MRQQLNNTMLILKALYPNCDFGLFNMDYEKFSLDVKLEENTTSQILYQKILNYNVAQPIDVEYVPEKISLEQLLKKLEQDNQYIRLKFLNNFLMFGELYFEKEEELRFIQDFFQSNNLSGDFDESLWVSYPLEDIQYYLGEFVRLNYEKNNSIIRNEKGFLSVGWNHNLIRISNGREAFFTQMMVKLNGLIKTLQENPSNNAKLETIKNTISITSYQRHKRNGTKTISNIFELIEHFRDALVHQEKSASNISKSVNSNSINVFCSVISHDDILVNFGDGEISIEHHIKPLLKQLIINFKEFETNIFSIIEKETNKVLFWDFCRPFDMIHNIPRHLCNFDVEIKYNQDKDTYRISWQRIVLPYEEILKRYQENQV